MKFDRRIHLETDRGAIQMESKNGDVEENRIVKAPAVFLWFSEFVMCAAQCSYARDKRRTAAARSGTLCN